MNHHALLRAQLRQLGLDGSSAPSAEAWAAFLRTVARTYTDAEQGCRTKERALAISSHELRELYDDLKQSSETQLAQERDKLREAKDHAQAEARRWKLVSDVASAVVTCRGYAALEHTMTSLLAPELPIEGFFVFEVEQGELRCPALPSGCDGAGGLASGKRIPLSCAGLRDLFRGNQLLPIAACSFVEPFATLLECANCDFGVLLPLWVGGDLQGVLLVSGSRTFTPDEQALLEALAPHLANAVANVRSHLKAEELSQARDRLSMLLVHDFKNPLAIIKLNLQLLADPCMHEEHRRGALDDSSQAADRLLHMFTDLLDIGRAEEGRLQLERESVDLAALSGDVLSGYEAGAEALGVSLRRSARPGMLVNADRQLLVRVLENLIGNGLRYVPRGGYIGVSAEREGTALCLRVENDGPSLDPDVHRRLFEKYGTGRDGQHPSSRGLGLYFCRLVVEAHGGTIAAFDRPGGGVCFEIRLQETSATSCRPMITADAVS